MLHAKVNSKGIETQRSVVKEEKRQRVDNQPYASFITEMFLRAFPNHPYNWVPIGSMEHLDAAQENDYVDFYKTFYVPSNATLSIAGDLDVEQTKIWIDKYFGSIPKGQAINMYRDYLSNDSDEFQTKYGVDKIVFDSTRFFESTNKAAKEKITELSNIPTIVKRTEKDQEPINGIIKDVIYDNIQLPALFMGYKFPEQTHEDSYALEMMNQVLSGGTSSRINKTIVEKEQIATYAGSFNYALEDSGLGIFLAIASKDVELDAIQTEFDAQIEKIKSELISDEEFQKIRTSIETGIVGMNSTVAGIAENLANNHVYFGSAEVTNEILDKYLSVTKEDIQRVAKNYLIQDRRVILHYLPKEK
jgi:predicted Zn-dependent peptidase